MRFSELQAGDSIVINGVRVTLEHKTGSRARLAIDTDNDAALVFVPRGDKSLDKSKSLPLARAGQIG